jgi:mRNA-degrading endonuclease toxin of MazEF toxin-antitoxin module
VALEPKPGLVVRYDFLWKEEEAAGKDSGKDRPCAIVLVLAEKADGGRDVLLCAITHSRPLKGETAVAVPSAVSQHLGLDDDQSWIKTDQVNVLSWPTGRIPYGITPASEGKWSFGEIPQALGQQIVEQVRAKARARTLRTVRRDDE